MADGSSYEVRARVVTIDDSETGLSSAQQKIDRFKRLTRRGTAAQLKVQALDEATQKIRKIASGAAALLRAPITIPVRVAGGALSILERIGHVARGLGAIRQLGEGIWRALSVPLNAASDLNETINKLDVIFESASGTIKRFGRTAAESVGISATEAMEAAGSFGYLFRNLKVNTATAADMSINLVRLAADLGSLNNVDPSDVLVKLRAGLVGEAEPLRTLGITLSEARVQQEAWARGIAPAGRDLTEQQKILARYSLILKDSKRAQGDFGRTSLQFANASRTVRASWREIVADAGTELILPAASAVMGRLARFVPQLRDQLRALYQRPDFQQASVIGKVRILWSEVGKSFDAWWGKDGQAEVVKRAGQVGEVVGGTLKGLLLGAFNLADPAGSANDSPWTRAGREAGGAFFDAFSKAFEAEKVAGAAGRALLNAQTPAVGGKNEGWGGIAVTTLTAAAIARAAAGIVGGGSKLLGGAKWAAGLFGKAAPAAAEAGAVAGVAGRGAGLLGVASKALGPIGLVITAIQLLEFLGRHEGTVRQITGLNGGGHGHDLCECLRRHLGGLADRLIPALRNGATPAVKPPSTLPPVPDPERPPGVSIPPGIDNEDQARRRDAEAARATNPAAEGAIAWAKSKLGSTGWMEWINGRLVTYCEKFIENAFGTDLRFGSAAAAASKFVTNAGGKLNDVARGMGVFFKAAADNRNAGHVGLSLGGGSFIHSDNRGVRITNPGDNDYGYWSSRFAGSGAIDFGTAPPPVAGNAGVGGGPGGAQISVTLASGAVVVQLSVDTLDAAHAERLADALGAPIAARIASAVEAQLMNTPAE